MPIGIPPIIKPGTESVLGVMPTPQEVADTTTRNTSSTSYTDLPSAFVNVDQGTGTYKIDFSVNSNHSSGKDTSFILAVNGVDQPETEIKVGDSGAGGSGSLTWLGPITDTQNIKLRFKVGLGNSDVLNYSLVVNRDK